MRVIAAAENSAVVLDEKEGWYLKGEGLSKEGMISSAEEMFGPLISDVRQLTGWPVEGPDGVYKVRKGRCTGVKTATCVNGLIRVSDGFTDKRLLTKQGACTVKEAYEKGYEPLTETGKKILADIRLFKKAWILLEREREE